MNQMLLSSQRLSTNKVLNTGLLDVFELLQQFGALDCLKLKADLPAFSLQLHWKEVCPPSTPNSFKDLAGKKLQDYKFQYLGQFHYNDHPIQATTESFSSDFLNQNIQNSSLENTNWVNCTWLIDFLMNADNIDADILRKETLFWRKEKDGYCLALSSEAIDFKHAEQQKIYFKDNFESYTWQHLTLFS